MMKNANVNLIQRILDVFQNIAASIQFNINEECDSRGTIYDMMERVISAYLISQVK